jgi:hypothetical protein
MGSFTLQWNQDVLSSSEDELVGVGGHNISTLRSHELYRVILLPPQSDRAELPIVADLSH